MMKIIGWSIVGLGVWTVAAPWIASFSHLSFARWNNVAVGAALMLLGIWLLLEERDKKPPADFS